MKKVMVVFGTRPEAIKLAPLIRELKGEGIFQTQVCLTAQHREMVDQVMALFRLKADFDLDIMIKNQSLAYVAAVVLERLTEILKKESPDLVLVQGDTTTVFATSLAAFFQKIMVGHVEAGLRTHQKYSPFPEEINRKLTASLANFHFAPTERAKQNLIDENINPDQIFVTGNTAIDALLWMKSEIDQLSKKRINEMLSSTGLDRQLIDNMAKNDVKLITVTAHRRENFGQPLVNICQALSDIANRNHDVEIVYPVHLNPKVQQTVYALLGDHPRIHLIRPVDYQQLVYLMSNSYLILTDSGGIQEEAPSLGKPVLVLRDVTERPEGIAAGVSILVGTEREKIVDCVEYLLYHPQEYQNIAQKVNPYGDGTASQKIVDILQTHLIQ